MLGGSHRRGTRIVLALTGSRGLDRRSFGGRLARSALAVVLRALILAIVVALSRLRWRSPGRGT